MAKMRSRTALGGNHDSEDADASVHSVLKSMRRSLRLGNFADTLRMQSETLRAAIRANSLSKESIDYYDVISAISEVEDYFDDLEAARIVEPAGRLIVAELSEWKKPVTEAEWAAYAAKARVIPHYSQAVYRRGSHQSALDIAEQGLRAVNDKLRDDMHSMSAERSRLTFQMAQALRRLHRFPEAMTAYGETLDICHERMHEAVEGLGASLRTARTEKDRSEALREFEEGRSAIHRATALASAIGLGAISTLSGRLKAGRPFLTLGRTLLLPMNDWLNSAYIDLLYGSYQRNMAGYNRKRLDEALTTLQHPYRVFADKNRAYQVRAAHQISLIYIYKEEYDAALDLVDEFQKISTDTGNSWGRCNALVLKSRIYRKDPSKRRAQPGAALDFANKALSLAKETKEAICVIDALIVAGEAHLQQENYTEAQKYFEEALDGSDNALIRAVCSVHLTRVFLQQKKLHVAEKHFERWQGLRGQIDNEVVQSLAKEVGAELAAQQQDFIVTAGTQDLKFDKHVERLREFLLTQARRRYPNSEEQVAEQLGVSRQTVYNWTRGKG